MSWTRKFLATLSAAALATAMLVTPAAATPSDDDDHKILICHVTHSVTNRYVAIEIDRAAFDGGLDSDHSQHSIDGFSDFILVNSTDCNSVTTF